MIFCLEKDNNTIYVHGNNRGNSELLKVFNFLETVRLRKREEIIRNKKWWKNEMEWNMIERWTKHVLMTYFGISKCKWPLFFKQKCTFEKILQFFKKLSIPNHHCLLQKMSFKITKLQQIDSFVGCLTRLPMKWF